MTTNAVSQPQTVRGPSAPSVAVLSIHPLYDTRIRNHIATLEAAGFAVTYLNWSAAPRPADVRQYAGVRLVHRAANSAFGWNVFRFAWMLHWFFWNAVRSRAQLVHLHDVLLLPLVWPLRLAGFRPIVFDAHEHYLDAAGLTGPFSRLAYRLFLPCVQGLVGVSKSTVPKINRPSVIVPNFQKRCDFVENLGDKGNVVTMVYFGSWSAEDRDVNLLLSVAERVLSASPVAEFRYGGRIVDSAAGETEVRLTALATRFGDRFTWFGEMAREQVVRETARANIGLLFLKSGTFNLTGSSPNKVFEYAAVGAAIFATDGFEIAAEVTSQGAGRLFPAGVDPNVVSEALLEIVNDPPKMQRIQSAAAELGRKYTWEAVAPRYLELYRQLGVEAKSPAIFPRN